jgi:hypothetical protein
LGSRPPQRTDGWEAGHSFADYPRWGDDDAPVLQRDWRRHATRLPYRKTYRLKVGDRWHDAPTTDAQWKHYVELEDDIVPVGAAIARELMTQGAVTALWTESWGRRPVFVSPDFVAVQPDGELAEILLAALHRKRPPMGRPARCDCAISRRPRCHARGEG